MQKQECCSLDNTIQLAGESMKSVITEKLKSLAEGDECHFQADHDFSKSLIEVLQEHFFESNFKAKFMEEGPKNWIIKVKNPKSGEGCCGCCS